MSGVPVITLTLRGFAALPSPVGRGREARSAGRVRASAALAPLLVTACAAGQTAAAVAPAAPGFLLGAWHGFIFPVAWVLSLFFPEVAVYAVPNNGGWYDFGYFVGVVFLGVGARKSRTVTITRRAR